MVLLERLRLLRKPIRLKQAAASCVLIGSLMSAGCAGPDDTAEQRVGELKNGTSTSLKPAIGQLFGNFGGCTASLISPRHAVTAAHCNLHADTLFGSNTVSIGGVSRNVSRIYLFGPEAQPGQGVPPGNLDFNVDVALLELDSAIPSANATPMFVSAGAPSGGRQSTMWGFGPNGVNCTGPSSKRFVTFNFGTNTSEFCPGDSGGPATYDGSTANGAIWGVTSFTSGNGDVWGNVSRYKEDILSVVRMWDAGNGMGLTGLEAGFRRDGVVLSTFTQSGAVACQASCNGNSSCNSFRFQTSSGACTLLSSVGDWVADPAFVSGLSAQDRFEIGVDRPGFDYNVTTQALSTCSLNCSNDSRCAAFSWVSSTSTCFLKEYGGLPSSGAGITSGVKRGFEYYTDRPGSDISDFDVTTPDVRVCQASCSSNPSCFSFTYRNPVFSPAHPPVQVTPAHCWLKNSNVSPVTVVGDPPSGNKRLISGFWRLTP